MRVFIADDHRILREGLKLLLAEAPGIQIAGEAGEANEVVRRVLAEKIDVLLLDSGLSISLRRPSVPRMLLTRACRQPQARPASAQIRTQPRSGTWSLDRPHPSADPSGVAS